jgi:hypothetical protein
MPRKNLQTRSKREPGRRVVAAQPHYQEADVADRQVRVEIAVGVNLISGRSTDLIALY